MNTWRYIPPLEANGKIQMAIDTWLLQKHQQGKHPSTLRFYTWSPPAISLGYHQRRYPQHWQKLTWGGKPLDIIRRPTGGRAVLHQDDLTYMVVTSRPSGQIIDIYKYLCEFLIVGWESLGINLHYGEGGREYLGNPNCLATSTPADLVTEDGYKFIGSALLKQGNYYLQHGSIRIGKNWQLYNQVFSTNFSQMNDFTVPDLDQIITSLCLAAAETLDIELVTQPLSSQEWSEIVTFSVKD